VLYFVRYHFGLIFQAINATQQIEQIKKGKESKMARRKRVFPWEVWSYSKLESLFTCPLSFYFRYVAKKEASKDIRTVFGEAIHRMARQFFSLKYGYKSEKRFLGAWRYYWFNQILKKKYPPEKIRMASPDDIGKFFAIGVNILKRFYQENLPYRKGEKLFPQVEKRFSLVFKGHRLVGIKDRIQPLKEGGVEIWDYKTGLREKTQKELKRDIQFTFYQLDHFKKTGENPKRMLIKYLATGKEDVVPLRGKSDFHQLGLWLDEARVYVKNILQPDDSWKEAPFRWLNPEDIKRKSFSPRPGSHCAYCDFESVCKFKEVQDAVRKEWLEKELKVSRAKTPSQLELDF
jgi:CRISPR/Cas system-associated exonuclease Cas4 (RecB family)